eukprot:5957155-Pleurochrysis_carterae.AAC.1
MHHYPLIPSTRSGRRHPLHGSPREVTCRVKRSLLRVPYLARPQQKVVGEQCRSPLDAALCRPPPVTRIGHSAEVGRAERPAQPSGTLRRVLLSHAFQCHRQRSPAKLLRGYVAPRLP